MAKSANKSAAKANGQITFRLGEEYAEVWAALEEHAAARGVSANVAAREIVVTHVLTGGLKAEAVEPMRSTPEGGSGLPHADLASVMRSVREASDGVKEDHAKQLAVLRGDLVNLFRAILMKFDGVKSEDVDRLVRHVFRAAKPPAPSAG